MILADYPRPKHIGNNKRYDNQPLFLENNCSIFYCFLTIVTSCAAKYRRDGEKRMSKSDSAAKKNIKNDHTHHLSISELFLFVTQCYAIFSALVSQG